MMLKDTIEEHSKIAHLYQKQIWATQTKGVNKVKKKDYQNLLQDADFINFAKATAGFLGNISNQMTIFDLRGSAIISNKYKKQKHLSSSSEMSNFIYKALFMVFDKYFLKSFLSSEKMSGALQGKANHLLILKDADERVRCSIISYIPIIDSNFNQDVIDGVVEIVSDATERWNQIMYLQEKWLIMLAIIFMIFVAMVIYYTSYAQKVLNKQFEANRDLEEAKMRAEHENTTKNQFFANITHELRTPLNSIIGFSDVMLSDSSKLPVNYQDYLNDISNAGKHLLSIINDILDLSKASADKLMVEAIELDLKKLISSSIRLVAPRADDAKVKLITSLPEDVVILKADPKRLKQVLINLLSNSIKFTPEAGSVTVILEPEPVKHLIHIKISDTGIGINEQDLPKALSAFGQIDNTLSKKYEGTGLGLPLTKKLVELMNGSFYIESKPKIGTSVTLTFKSEI